MPPALVLCGGLGTRLRAVYSHGPKALAPVSGRPFLDYMLDWLRRQGIWRVVLCVGYRAEQIRELYPEGSGDPEIRYSVENEPLGTAGAVKNAEGLIDAERFFVLNGDSLADVSLAELLAFHCKHSAQATLATVTVDAAARFGSVLLDADGRVTGFLEKSAITASGPQNVNAGIYVLERAVLARIPAGRAVSFERELFPALAGSGLYGFQTNGSFIDIGVPEDLASAQAEIPGRFTA
jgi:NDP-sugar pyrophosphorylase family protein